MSQIITTDNQQNCKIKTAYLNPDGIKNYRKFSALKKHFLVSYVREVKNERRENNGQRQG